MLLIHPKGDGLHLRTPDSRSLLPHPTPPRLSGLKSVLCAPEPVSVLRISSFVSHSFLRPNTIPLCGPAPLAPIVLETDTWVVFSLLAIVDRAVLNTQAQVFGHPLSDLWGRISQEWGPGS